MSVYVVFVSFFVFVCVCVCMLIGVCVCVSVCVLLYSHYTSLCRSASTHRTKCIILNHPSFSTDSIIALVMIS